MALEKQRMYRKNIDGTKDLIYRETSSDLVKHGNTDLNTKVNEIDSSLADIVHNNLTISVKDFGAKGDGVTDDTNAIQNTIDYCILNGGRKIFFPSGVYRITSTLIVNSLDVNLCGEGFSSSVIQLVGDITGIQCNRTTLINNIYIKGDNKQGVGVITKGGVAKVIICNCKISNCNIGIISTHSWTIWVRECEIFRNNIAYSIYYSTGETTTINIISNTMWENGKNIVVGDSTMPNYQNNTQCTTLNIKDNALDNAPCEIYGVVVNINYIGNHAELTSSFEYILKLERPYKTTIENNYFRGAKKGIVIDNNATRNVNIENNAFYNIAEVAIDILKAYHSYFEINNNYYSGCKYKIYYPYNDSGKYVGARVMMKCDEYENLVNGSLLVFADSAPTTGRYRIGSKVLSTISNAVNKGWVFTTTSNNWGMQRVTKITSTCTTDGVNNTATPANIDNFQIGDYIKITGEASSSVVTEIDYTNKKFKTDPKILTTATDVQVDILNGTWTAF